jgi:hypothetical protein
MKQPDFRSPDFELKLWDQIHGAGNATFDGHWCTQCRKRIPDDDIIGPINIVIRDPELIGPEGMEREFCTWECAADWFEAQAGRRPRYSGGK